MNHICVIRIGTFILRALRWTDDEVELPLRATLNYKTTTFVENVDWKLLLLWFFFFYAFYDYSRELRCLQL